MRKEKYRDVRISLMICYKTISKITSTFPYFISFSCNKLLCTSKQKEKVITQNLNSLMNNLDFHDCLQILILVVQNKIKIYFKIYPKSVKWYQLFYLNFRVISQLINLTEAKARIEGPDDKEVHVKQRSRVKLTCVVDLGRGHGQDSAAVFWYLDGKALDWLGQTGPGRGVQVINGLIVYQTHVQYS